MSSSNGIEGGVEQQHDTLLAVIVQCGHLNLLRTPPQMGTQYGMGSGT